MSPSALWPWKAVWSRPALLLTPKHAHLFWPGETLSHNSVGTWNTSLLSTILDSSFSRSPCETPPQLVSALPLNIWYETCSHTTTTTTLIPAAHLDYSTTKKKRQLEWPPALVQVWSHSFMTHLPLLPSWLQSPWSPCSWNMKDMLLPQDLCIGRSLCQRSFP